MAEENDKDKDKDKDKNKKPDKGGSPADGDKKPDTPPADGGQTLTWDEVYKSKRFKELNDAKKKAETKLAALKSQQQKAEEADLKEKEKYKELYEGAEKKLGELQAKQAQMVREHAIVSAAVKAGAQNPNDIVKLIDSDAVTVAEDGTVSGAEEAVTALLKEKAYLVGTGDDGKPKNIGAGINPDAGAGAKPTYKMSDLQKKMQDHAWYKEHKDEIEAAEQEGRIDYDH